MIDLHTHILPAVDDGASDLAEALAMARSGVEEGLTVIAATPHFYEIRDWSRVKEKVKELQAELNKNQIALELVAGAELMLDIDILAMKASDIPTYGDQGKFCLLELPLRQIPIYTEQVLFDLQTKGITPIIAHPERYAAVVENPNVVLDWIKTGSLIQMNTGSILGRFGSQIQETAQIMLTHQMIHFVASDAHGAERRRLNLPDAFPALAQVVGSHMATDLVTNNPRAILQGDFRPQAKPLEYKKKKRFFFF